MLTDREEYVLGRVIEIDAGYDPETEGEDETYAELVHRGLVNFETGKATEEGFRAYWCTPHVGAH